jgi:hypothetical protein
MKIRVNRIELSGSSRIIHFEDEVIVVPAYSAMETNSIGTRALRILRMHVGKAEVSYSPRHKRQMEVHYPRANKHLDTLEALQSAMDQHANTRLRVTGFRKTSVMGAARGKQVILKKPEDAEAFLEENPRGTIRATRDVLLNMPTVMQDAIQMGRVLPGIHCSRWDAEREIDLEALRLSIYIPDPNPDFRQSTQGKDPWSLMKGLEQKIRTVISE